MSTSVPCPTCGVTVPWADESRWRPFCSERCKLLDLTGWMFEEYRIPDPRPPEASPDGDPGEDDEPYPT